MVFGLGILKLDVQAVFDSHVHLDGAVGFRRYPVGVDPNVLLPDDIGHSSRHCDPDEISQLDVDAIVRLVLLLDILEVEIKCLGVLQISGSGELLAEREELIVVASIKEHFWTFMSAKPGQRRLPGAPTNCADELNLDPCVLQPLAILRPHRHSSLDRLPVLVERAFLSSVLVELDIDHGPVIAVLEHNVDIDGRGEEVRHAHGGCAVAGAEMVGVWRAAEAASMALV
jgi:hypothetical protein